MSQACLLQVSFPPWDAAARQLNDWEFSHTQGFNLDKGQVELERLERGEMECHLPLKPTFRKVKLEASGMNNKCWLIPELRHKPLQHSCVSAHQPSSKDVASCRCRGTPSASNAAGALPSLGTERWRKRETETEMGKGAEGMQIIVGEERQRHNSCISV